MLNDIIEEILELKKIGVTISNNLIPKIKTIDLKEYEHMGNSEIVDLLMDLYN